MNDSGDTNSLWQITNCMGCKEKPTGTPVKCGNKIRLTHTRTSKNLHSHKHQAPISGRLEVSAFGTDGKGDKGDNWKLTCMNKEANGFIRILKSPSIGEIVEEIALLWVNWKSVQEKRERKVRYGKSTKECYLKFGTTSTWKVASLKRPSYESDSLALRFCLLL